MEYYIIFIYIHHINISICWNLHKQSSRLMLYWFLGLKRMSYCVLTQNTWCNLPIISNKLTLIWSEPYVAFTFHWPYRALVLQTHHQGAHITCGLVINYDHGFLFWDGSYIITPLCDCEWKITENSWLYTICSYQLSLETILGVLKGHNLIYFKNNRC